MCDSIKSWDPEEMGTRIPCGCHPYITISGMREVTSQQIPWILRG